ncbi:MAG TPA: N-acetylmuramoyl-L-alanine amidase, partial [Candidatus Polarisedimenticolaceae bacterium]|nr:N-acetylmuramoyl-L-alanine amidase [Candidatus Polarisedimenticolaceae bacterium]
MTRSASVALALLLAAGMPAAAAPERVHVAISVDTGGPSTRLVLTHSADLGYTLRSAEGRVEIVYDRPVDVDPDDSRLDDSILVKWNTEDHERIVLYTGTDYRSYESFELRNPLRLVLDLQGSRREERATPPPPAPAGLRQVVVVVDPGHGGIELGATGAKGLQEKDVTLDLALRVKQALQPVAGLTVVLTRDEDRLVGLDERAAIANHNDAALFVSLHVNASPRAKAHGAETYYLSSDATDEDARTLAALENRTPAAGGGASGGEAARRDLDLILWDLAQNQSLKESGELAEAVQRQLNRVAGTSDRGVRQAPFRVLMGAAMPAILVEVGFITNPAEEEQLAAQTYRNQLADAIASAVRDYLERAKRLA